MPERREHKNKKVKKYRPPININLGLIIFGAIFVYLIIVVVTYLKSEHIAPYEVTLGSLAVNNTYTGVILRDETVVESNYSGYINYYAREGEKVANNSMVYTIDATGKINDLINNDSGDTVMLTKEDMSELKTAISTFSSGFDPVNYSDTYDFKFNIEGTVLKIANYKVLANIDEYRSGEYADNVNFGYAPASGILVYSVDGYETLTSEDMTRALLYNENYEKKQFASSDLISEGDPAYKLITAEEWSLLIEIDEQKCKELEDKDYINVRFLKNNYTSWAAVSILRQDGTIFAKLDFNNSMVTFATDRFLEIELLSGSDQGLKIPNSAIVERPFYLIPVDYLTYGDNGVDEGFMREGFLEDGTPTTEFIKATIYALYDDQYYVDESVFKIGDYIIKPETGDKYPISKQGMLTGVYNINKGYADFKQITVLYQNEEYSIVKSNTQYGLNVYDHIVLKGDSVNANDFIYE
ncbi:MAG: hypothetical protein K6E88_00770 [Lachnospiraceae bacterium]|nr:hypothetical protein [Lachnospiraceae bacterium]